MQITLRDIEDKNKIIDKQQKEIEQLKDELELKEIFEKGVKVLMKDFSKKVEHLFPLEDNIWYGKLCDKVLEQQKIIDLYEELALKHHY